MEQRVKLIMLTSGISQKSGNPYYRAVFKQLGDENRNPQMLNEWLSAEVGAHAVQLGLCELTKQQEPEVRLTFGFGGKITGIELIPDDSFNDEVVFD